MSNTVFAETRCFHSCEFHLSTLLIVKSKLYNHDLIPFCMFSICILRFRDACRSIVHAIKYVLVICLLTYWTKFETELYRKRPPFIRGPRRSSTVHPSISVSDRTFLVYSYIATATPLRFWKLLTASPLWCFVPRTSERKVGSSSSCCAICHLVHLACHRRAGLL